MVLLSPFLSAAISCMPSGGVFTTVPSGLRTRTYTRFRRFRSRWDTRRPISHSAALPPPTGFSLELCLPATKSRHSQISLCGKTARSRILPANSPPWKGPVSTGSLRNQESAEERNSTDKVAKDFNIVGDIIQLPAKKQYGKATHRKLDDWGLELSKQR
jgi:hypothetical protein